MEMSDIKILSSDNTIQVGSSVLTIKGLLRLRKGGELVGELDAQIDFKDLPLEYHQSALSMLMGMGRELYLPPDEPAVHSSNKLSSELSDESDDKPSIRMVMREKIKKFFRIRL